MAAEAIPPGAKAVRELSRARGNSRGSTGPQYLQRPTVPVGPKAGTVAEVATVVI